ncbi:MAG TPA: hypothetical protein VFX19_06400 [Dehalococcoidia bacterium]|nr:hypothetical protein [Dehalococcoidia bacterium]
MNRWLAPFLTLLVFLVLATPSEAQVDILPVTISGGGLREAVHLAPIDADAFRRRVNLPPRLDNSPDLQGESYVITSPYWNSAVKREDGAEEKQRVDEAAIYYPDGGFTRTHLGGVEVWIVLDLRQRQIIDTYIGLSKAGQIGPNDGGLSVMRATAADKPIGIDAGGTPLTPEQRDTFWSALGDTPATFLDPQAPPEAGSDGFWLLFTVPDAHGYQYFYDGSTLTDLLGTERYTVPSVLGAFLHSLTPEMPAIENQEPAGSLLWWPVMIGGGLAAIAAAVWLQRRNAPSG